MLSITVIAKNEAHNIERCLQSVAWADEIIVLDSGSTDNTVDLAKRYTQNVFHTDWQGYGIQKQRALEKATGTWVLNIDADEFVSEELKQAILLAISKDTADAFRIPIHLSFYGRALRYSCCPQRHIRLFKRQITHYNENIVHEAIVLPKAARIGKINQPLHHCSYQNVEHALHKMNIYSTSSAVMRSQSKNPPSFLKTVFGAWWMFFRCYVLQRGFMEGRDGFVLAMMNAEGSFYRSIKMMYAAQEKRPAMTAMICEKETENG